MHHVSIHNRIWEFDWPPLTITKGVEKVVALEVFEPQRAERGAVLFIQVGTEVDVCWPVYPSVEVDRSPADEDGITAYRMICSLG